MSLLTALSNLATAAGSSSSADVLRAWGEALAAPTGEGRLYSDPTTARQHYAREARTNVVRAATAARTFLAEGKPPPETLLAAMRTFTIAGALLRAPGFAS